MVGWFTFSYNPFSRGLSIPSSHFYQFLAIYSAIWPYPVKISTKDSPLEYAVSTHYCFVYTVSLGQGMRLIILGRIQAPPRAPLARPPQDESPFHCEIAFCSRHSDSGPFLASYAQRQPNQKGWVVSRPRPPGMWRIVSLSRN